jgi:branched-chain amino acid transport system permease protein
LQLRVPGARPVEYVEHLLFMTSVYAILGVSLSLSVGQVGMISVMHAGFFGIGAYSAALLTTRFAFSTPVAWLLAMFITAVAALAVALSTVRWRSDFFAVGTFGIQMIIQGLLANWIELTKGPFGISDIPRPSIAGWSFSTTSAMLSLSGILLACTVVMSAKLIHSPYGRVLRAIRDDEMLASMRGKYTNGAKQTSFVIGACFASAAGCIFSQYMQYIDPTSFTVMESVLILSIVVVGGAYRVAGPVVGAVVLVILPEILRFVGISSTVAANIRQILYGLALVACILWRSQGLIGEHSFGRETRTQ